jgi:hypothetical protein
VVAVRARMQVSRLCQGEHPLHVPRRGDEGPLTLDIFEPTQQELAEAHRRFDDPEHRLRDLLAQGIELLAFGRLQAVAHGFERRRLLRRRPYFGKSAPTRADNATGGPAQSSDRSAPQRRGPRWLR